MRSLKSDFYAIRFWLAMAIITLSGCAPPRSIGDLPPRVTSTFFTPTSPVVVTNTTMPIPIPSSTLDLQAASVVAITASTQQPVSEASTEAVMTPAIWPTVTRQVLPPAVAASLSPCPERTVSDDLLVVVTQQFGLPRSFVPADLVPVSEYFSEGVTVGIESSVREAIITPLRELIEAMHAAGLAPSILSGYRSYDEQYLAWKWWNSQYPERVAIMSARAGYSEHQLGTTVDFGSPALDHLFHVDFAGTPEGLWLVENAHRFGFTMSYPADTTAITGFKYEPWHFRYVGVELSTELRSTGQILTEWQLANMPPPCIP